MNRKFVSRQAVLVVSLLVVGCSRRPSREDRLAIVGGGRDQEYAVQLHSLASELGISGDVVFVGAVPLEETVHFFREMLQGGRPSHELIDGDYAVVNELLAAHYGIAGVKGAEFRRVDGVKKETLQRAQFARRDEFMIAGIGIRDAAAAGRHTIEAAFIERLEISEDGAGP